MIIISHRGNLTGSNLESENHPNQIIKSLGEGFDVEIDVWFKDEKWFLGHDEPKHELNWSFILKYKNKLWVHTKNLESVNKLQHTDTNWFWHQEDYVTLTSKGYVWCFPGYETEGGIMVDHGQKTDKKILGICTDNPQNIGKL